MFSLKKRPSASNPIPAILCYRVQVSRNGSWVVVQEFSGRDLLPDEAIKYALGLFANSICNVSVMTLDSLDKWVPIASFMRYDKLPCADEGSL